MEEVGVNGTAEAPHYEPGHDQRHRKIEISAQERLEPIRCAYFFLNADSERCISRRQRSSPLGMSQTRLRPAGAFSVSFAHWQSKLFWKTGGKARNKLAAKLPQSNEEMIRAVEDIVKGRWPIQAQFWLESATRVGLSSPLNLISIH